MVDPASVSQVAKGSTNDTAPPNIFCMFIAKVLLPLICQSRNPAPVNKLVAQNVS